MYRRFTVVMLWASAATASLAWGQAVEGPGVKVAAVQLLGYDKTDLPRPDVDPTAQVVAYIERAARDQAELIAFPEYLLGHIRVPGPQTERISAAAAAAKIYVVVGCWESLAGESYANAALLFDREGKIAGKYRKVHAAVDQWEGDRPWVEPPVGKDLDWFMRHDPEWRMQRGTTFPVFTLDFGTVGILTCYDGWFPETSRALSLNGAEILIWINGRRGQVEDFIVRAETFRNEVAMIATNQAYGSGTMIAQWPHQVLTRVEQAGEHYVTARIDVARVRRARQASRNAAQRRPDLYGVISAAPANVGGPDAPSSKDP